METCAVCLEDIDTAWSFPGCGHRFHPECVLNFAQFDTRCPVCRHQVDGVTSKTDQRNTDLQERLAEARSEWRRYTARRRRLLQTNPDVNKQFEHLRHVRVQLGSETSTLRRLYDTRCREVWRTDPGIRQGRLLLGRLRRQELRLERLVATFLEEHIGSEPF